MTIKPSLLHRIFHIKPGSVPTWICTTRCEGFDFLVAIGVVALIGGLYLLTLNIWAGISVLALLFWFVKYIHAPCEACERVAR